MRRLGAIFLVLLILTGCSVPPAPERKVAEFLDKLADGNIKSAGKLTLTGSLGLDKKAQTLYKPLFASIRYSISGSVIEDGVAKVSVSILAIDMEEVMSDASVEVVSHILSSGAKSSDELFYQILQEKLEESNPPTVTSSATAKLVKEGRYWKIDLSASGGFADAITGGVGDILSAG